MRGRRPDPNRSTSERDPDALERLAAVVEWSQDPIISTNLDGRVLSWNPAAELLYGFGEDEMAGESIALVVPAERVAELRAALEQVSRGQRVPHHETVRRAKSGSLVEVAVAISPIRSTDGVVVAASFVERDLTESRWMASTLDTTLKTLEEAVSDAQAAEMASRRFLADAAHQLRTPVAGIKAAAENLLLGADAEDRARLLADLVRESSRAGRLIGSLLEIARLDEGEPLAPAACDLVALCADEADRLWSLAPHLDVVLKAEELPPDPPALDQGAVREIVANLLDNASRHALSEIRIEIAPSGGDIELKITDDGPGLPTGSEEHAFQRFVSLDDRGGSGLGLAIARELARAHGGDLCYYNRTFALRLPAAEQATDGGELRS